MQEIWRDRSRRQLRKLSCSQRSRKEGVVSRLEGWGEARKGYKAPAGSLDQLGGRSGLGGAGV